MKKEFIHACKEFSIDIHEHVSLAPHCSFQTGGEAEMYYEVKTVDELSVLVTLCNTHHVEIHVIGGGTNILPPDSTLEGLTLSTHGLKGITIDDTTTTLLAGTSVREATSGLANTGKRGLDFLYGMPGTIGGAVWMNARCYGQEISESLIHAQGITREGDPWEYTSNTEDFAYKISPFRNNSNMFIITSCTFKVTRDSEEAIWTDMLAHEMDRHTKGHYIAPCAGSVFKNNKLFGRPSGQILDELAWKNKHYNGAKVSPFHANIIINHAHASAQDIYTLSYQMKKSVFEKNNIELEHELIFLGEDTQWNS